MTEVTAPTMKAMVEKAPAQRSTHSRRQRGGSERQRLVRRTARGGARGRKGGRRRGSRRQQVRPAPCSLKQAQAISHSPPARPPARHYARPRTVVDGGGAQDAALVLLPLGLEAVLRGQQHKDEDREDGLQQAQRGVHSRHSAAGVSLEG